MQQNFLHLDFYLDFWICSCIWKEERCLWKAGVLSFNPSSCLGELNFSSSHLQQDVKEFRNVSSVWGRPYSCDYWVKRYTLMIVKKYCEILRWKVLCKNDDFIPFNISLFMMMSCNEKGSILKLDTQIWWGNLYSACSKFSMSIWHSYTTNPHLLTTK